MLSVIPLMIIPFIAYNVILVTGTSANPWDGTVFSVTLISGGQWTMSLGAMLLAVGLLFLFFEIL